MTALPSHLPAFSFFGGSLFFSGGLFCPVAVSSSSRQQTFFFFGGSLFFLRWPFLSRCCFLLFPPANFLFLRQFSFFSPEAFLVPLLFPPLPASKLSFSAAVLFFFSGGLSRSVAVSSSSRQQTFFFFCGSLFRSAVFFVPQRFSSVFFRVGAFRPPLFRGLKYCKRSDKKRRPPLYAEAACQVPVAPGKCACRGRARRSPEIGPKPEVCSFDRRDGAQNRENELPARKRRLRAHGSLMW